MGTRPEIVIGSPSNHGSSRPGLTGIQASASVACASRIVDQGRSRRGHEMDLHGTARQILALPSDDREILADDTTGHSLDTIELQRVLHAANAASGHHV